MIKRLPRKIIIGVVLLVLVGIGVAFLMADITQTKQPLQMAKIQTGQLTLTGRLVPNVNTSMSRYDGLIFEQTKSHDGYIAGYEHPFKYFLYDTQYDAVELSFSADSFAGLQQQFMASQYMVAQPTPDIWSNHPEYIATTALWQVWAGQWVSVTGEFDTNGIFHVNALQRATSPSIQSTMVTRYAEFIDTVAFIGDYPPYLSEHSVAPFLIVGATRQDGSSLGIVVYYNFSSWTRLEVTRPIFHIWARIKGWRFDSPRYSEYPDVVEVQSIEELPTLHATVSPPPPILPRRSLWN